MPLLTDPFCLPEVLKESQGVGDSNPLHEYFHLHVPDMLALIWDSGLSGLSKGILRIYKEPS